MTENKKKLKSEEESDKNQKGLWDDKMWYIWAILILVVVFFALYWIFSAISDFEYKGLKFVKESYGDMIIYRYSYYYQSGQETYKNNVYLRTDPRKNDVSIDGQIYYLKGKTAFISINSTGLTKCEDAVIGVSTIAGFLGNNLIETKSAFFDQQEAIAKNKTLVNCQTNPKDMVLILREGNETKITARGMCYDIQISNCEIMPAVEKFIIQSIIDAKENNALPNVE